MRPTDKSWWTGGVFEGRPVPELLAARDLGAVFRFLKTRGWSRAAIAAATGLSETRVRAVAKGDQQITSYEVLERIAAGLDINRGLLGLAYGRHGSHADTVTTVDNPHSAPADLATMDAAGTPSAAEVEPSETFAIELLRQAIRTLPGDDHSLSGRDRDLAFRRLVTALRTLADTMNRRTLLNLLGWAAAAAAAAPAEPGLHPDEQQRLSDAIRSPGRVDDRVVDHIEQVLWCAMRQDDALGPHAALDTVLAQRNLTKVMIAECRSTVTSRLLSIFANLSRYAGWLAFDLNDFDTATYYYEEARTAAHEAENTELGAFVLCNMSHLATWQGRPRVAIDHAVAAQGWANRTDDMRLQAYACDVAARAYAMDSQHDVCMDELDRAQEQVAGADQRPSLAYFYNEGLLASVRGQCLQQLHRFREAAQVTERSLTALDRSYTRNVALTMIDLAGTYASLEEVDQAATTVGEAATLAVHNHSGRLIAQVGTLRTRLEPWRASQAIRQLNEHLDDLGIP